MVPRNWFQGMNSSSLCSLAGRYDNPIPHRCLAPHRLFKNSSSADWWNWLDWKTREERWVGLRMIACREVEFMNVQFVEVSRHNLESFQTWGFCLECLHYKTVSLIKKKTTYSSYEEIHMGSGAKSYMRKGFLICEEMRKYFTIYEDAVLFSFFFSVQTTFAQGGRVNLLGAWRGDCE